MIVPEDSASKSSGSTGNVKETAVGSEVDDPPPPSYTSQVDPSESSTGPGALPVTSKTKPTNHLALANEQNTLKGEFVIDPSIQIPSSLLPPLRDGETEADRKNLRLSSRNGSVHADIWLLPGGGQKDTRTGQQTSRRTTICLASDHGSINAQLQRADDAGPFIMSACAPHGSVKISLPRSFQGLLSFSTRYGGICLSDLVLRNATQLGQVDDTRRYFVGDLQSFGDGAWNGDEIVITAKHGHIHIKYVDEALGDQSKGGFFSRLFKR